MNDSILRQNVIDELEFEPAVDAAHIGVAVEDGVVTLSGHVGSYAEKLAAEKAVKRVKGVRALAEGIKVRFPEDKKTSDDEIAHRAITILKWSAVVPPNAVMVKVQDGWVTLSGEVDWQHQRWTAENLVRRLSGIHGVMNSIKLKHKVEPRDVKRKIENALRRSAEIVSERIQVSVEDGRSVALDGSVHDWEERDAVERAAWSVPGVTRVIDRLRISV
ncbi:MAG TPA: BON domain-containing protein [Rhizomicrobium sp.]|nr:BON domain-containing protein [Rhizomicrobium sp.]